MKLNKLIIIALPLLLQGCSSFFEEKYNDKELFEKMTDLQDIENSKQESFLSLDTSYLGKEVSYDKQQKVLLDKQINLISYSPVNIYTVLEMLGEQMDITYKVDANPPAGADGSIVLSENALDSMVYTINFKGDLNEFIVYLSNLYDVNIQLKKIVY